MKSNWLPEIVKRSENGPYQKESEYDLTLAKTVMRLVKEYDIQYEPLVLVPSDDGLAGRVYQAAFDLVLEMGIYNQSTQRRILFSREEIEEAVAAAPSEVILGEGKDAVIERHREVEGMEPCCMHSGPTGTPTSEKYHALILQSCAQEPLVDCLGHGSVATYQGQMIIPGTPLEILGAQRDAAQARESIRKAGRPGMHIEDMALPLTCAGKISTFNPASGMRPSDALLVSQMPELKTDYDQLSRVAYLGSVGMHIVDLMTPLIGGLGGGAQGTAIVTVACHLLGVLLYDVSNHFMGHMSLQWSHNTGPMGLWIQAVAGQALALNTPMVSVNDLYTRSGLGTEEIFWEIAAGAMIGSVCGLHQHGVGATCGNELDHTSGLEARFQAEVAHAGLGRTRAEVNDLVLVCLEKYQDKLAKPNLGKPFPELVDLDTLEYTREWLDFYLKAKEELEEMGLDMNDGWKKALSRRKK
ncbi:MAG: monomethylamine:corrinoid methyltransferase, partial [Anaerolineales bacterium]|nr:monomethylamine:corrinoid methyltransferase [Anaerolineales bacterium]